MLKPVKIKALANYQLWLKFEDGIEGTVDLSHLTGKGVFALWNDIGNFKRVQIGKHGEISWSPEVEICADNLYLEITGKRAEEIFSPPERKRLSA